MGRARRVCRILASVSRVGLLAVQAMTDLTPSAKLRHAAAIFDRHQFGNATQGELDLALRHIEDGWAEAVTLMRARPATP
jgi:hypothetical protein